MQKLYSKLNKLSVLVSKQFPMSENNFNLKKDSILFYFLEIGIAWTFALVRWLFETKAFYVLKLKEIL